MGITYKLNPKLLENVVKIEMAWQCARGGLLPTNQVATRDDGFTEKR